MRTPVPTDDLKPPAPPTPPDAEDGDDDRVTLVVNLLPDVYAAMNTAHELTGDSRTDVVNRALVFYARLMQMAAHGGGSATYHDRSGRLHRIVIA